MSESSPTHMLALRVKKAIIAFPDRELLRDIRSTPDGGEAELLVLTGVTGSHSMLAAEIMNGILTTEETIALLPFLRDAGRLGFSFPLRRWMAVSYPEAPSLLNAFGMETVRRDTDRDINGKDIMGSGFRMLTDDFYTEYRRSYIRFSDTKLGVIIRNSSYYFGRTALRHPVYIHLGNDSPNGPSGDIHTDNIEEAGFLPLHKIAPLLLGHADNLTNLMNRWNAFEIELTRTVLTSTGYCFPDLLHWLNVHLKNLPDNKPSPIFITTVKRELPPWFPEHAVQLNGEILNALKRVESSLYPVLYPCQESYPALLSAASGDLPG